MKPWVAIFAVLACANSHAAQAQPSESLRKERAALQLLWPALDYGEKVGRIYYRGSCQLGAGRAAGFPQLHLQASSKGKSGVAAVRDIFRHERDISVSDTDPGIIRVKIGRVPDAVLQVRISNLALTPEEQYNYWLAIFKIQNAPEVRVAMQELNLRTPTRAFDMLIAKPADGSPRLPAALTNVTMDQALDLVAKTFKGIILYGFCTPPDQYQIDFANAGYIYSTN